jgi:predicted SnoaL-like aldol condensation-catalyzing enzyme
MDSRIERNKTSVVAFYDLVFNQEQSAETVHRYVSASYTQHTPHVGDGIAPSLRTSSGWRRNIRRSASRSSALTPRTTTGC